MCKHLLSGYTCDFDETLFLKSISSIYFLNFVYTYLQRIPSLDNLLQKKISFIYRGIHLFAPTK